MCDVIEARQSRLKHLNCYWLLLHQKQELTQPAYDEVMLGTDKRKDRWRTVLI